jgi:5-methylcytosine-specific restriction enzyme A
VKTFLLTWNPKYKEGWPDADYEQAIASTAGGVAVDDRWSVGVRKGGIAVGDRAFMLRTERDRGLVASGQFTSEIFSDLHWNGSQKMIPYAFVRFDTVLAPEDRLPTEVLKQELPLAKWDRFQGGGIDLDAVASQLERLWASHNGQLIYLSPEESLTGTFPEGALTRIEVNRYERDRAARRACIKHWGVSCVVCGIDFEKTYGAFAKGFIHVHHLRELSTVGEGYEVDPIEDLRPVCPNCHAMVHKTRPAMTIKKLQGKLRKAAAST